MDIWYEACAVHSIDDLDPSAVELKRVRAQIDCYNLSDKYMTLDLGAYIPVSRPNPRQSCFSYCGFL